jgi:hypothetical protein
MNKYIICAEYDDGTALSAKEERYLLGRQEGRVFFNAAQADKELQRLETQKKFVDGCQNLRYYLKREDM